MDDSAIFGPGLPSPNLAQASASGTFPLLVKMSFRNAELAEAVEKQTGFPSVEYLGCYRPESLMSYESRDRFND